MVLVSFARPARASSTINHGVFRRGGADRTAHRAMSMRKFVLQAFSGVLAAFAAAGSCHAENFAARDVLEDAKLYFTAPIRWDTRDWLYFGGALAAIGVAHEYDGNVRRHFAVGARAALDGNDKNSVRDAIPAAAAVDGTWVFATVLDDSSGRVEAYTMLEAGGFSAVTTEALKFAAGRARPNETTRVDDWRKGGSSFPSLHASAAFAIGTGLAESGSDDFRWVRPVFGYCLAGPTPPPPVPRTISSNPHTVS